MAMKMLMAQLFERGTVIDPITVHEELKSTGELEAAGGIAYIGTLLEAVPTAANIEYHARIVQQKAVVRSLIDAAKTIIQDAHDGGPSPPASPPRGDGPRRLSDS